MENPKPGTHKYIKIGILAAGLVVAAAGTYFGITAFTAPADEVEHPVECTTDNIGCILQRLLFDLIPLLIFTSGELVDLTDEEKAQVEPDPREGWKPFGQTD